MSYDKHCYEPMKLVSLGAFYEVNVLRNELNKPICAKQKMTKGLLLAFFWWLLVVAEVYERTC